MGVAPLAFLHVVTAARVLVTPPAVIAPSAAAAVAGPPPDEPCAVDHFSDGEEELPELSPCTRCPWVPAACTRLLRGNEECGARVGGVVVPPDSCKGGYYGCDGSLEPAHVLEHGLPAQGSDWDLIHHAEGVLGDSAFRSTTKQVTYPDGGGAAACADEGGYVYELT